MKSTFIRKALFTLVGAAIISATATMPFAAYAHGVTKPEPGVTVRSYDMDEYLDKLLATGQYDKYNRFAQIADTESWTKHVENQKVLAQEYALYAENGQSLLGAIMAQADKLGFNVWRDTFSLLDFDGEIALIKVWHDGKDYIVKLRSVSSGTWKVVYFSGMN